MEFQKLKQGDLGQKVWYVFTYDSALYDKGVHSEIDEWNPAMIWSPKSDMTHIQ